MDLSNGVAVLVKKGNTTVWRYLAKDESKECIKTIITEEETMTDDEVTILPGSQVNVEGVKEVIDAISNLTFPNETVAANEILS